MVPALLAHLLSLGAPAAEIRIIAANVRRTTSFKISHALSVPRSYPTAKPASPSNLA